VKTDGTHGKRTMDDLGSDDGHAGDRHRFTFRGAGWCTKEVTPQHNVAAQAKELVTTKRCIRGLLDTTLYDAFCLLLHLFRKPH